MSIPILNLMAASAAELSPFLDSPCVRLEVCRGSIVVRASGLHDSTDVAFQQGLSPQMMRDARFPEDILEQCFQETVQSLLEYCLRAKPSL